MSQTAGNRLKAAMNLENPLQIVGTVNAYCALMAERAGFRAIYLSGAGVANSSFGLPDLGATSLPEVAEDVRRITSRTELPLLVDADTGWGTALNISRTVDTLTRAGAAGIHLEDQQAAKRCGHRPGKALVDTDEMVDRIRAAIDDRRDDSFMVMARTDALASEGLESSIERCQAYVEAGADAIFAEAIADLEQYRKFTSSLAVPVLANMTEFGKTPLMDLKQLESAGVAMVLYPLSVFRAMSKAADTAYTSIRENGTQAKVVELMQTRDELYDLLNYHHYEAQIDNILKKAKP